MISCICLNKINILFCSYLSLLNYFFVLLFSVFTKYLIKHCNSIFVQVCSVVWILLILYKAGLVHHFTNSTYSINNTVIPHTAADLEQIMKAQVNPFYTAHLLICERHIVLPWFVCPSQITSQPLCSKDFKITSH